MAYLNRKQQAEYLNKQHGLKSTPASLAKQAWDGTGPEYQMWGNQAVSTPEQLDAYVVRKLGAPRKSTSHDPNCRPAVEAPAIPELDTEASSTTEPVNLHAAD